MRILIQTKDAADRLIKAGLSRRQFKCRTKRTDKGEYEFYPTIYLKPEVEVTPALVLSLIANGFNLSCLHLSSTGYTTWLVKDREYNDQPKISISVY